ncbi:thiosulfate sulfurtransferase GlpE [Pleionea sediminis]|uniref:thiosulfate sulfurtransferase GlpE n=1 Tax=Pleionea sediminis TaxID=2569479 RepID=UPI001184FB7C|nr:thiosulfate sulfurtransferase GlpE [Pleionea sediminis]
MFKRISIVEAKALIDQQEANVADIRDPQSFNNGHIPKSVHLTNDNIEHFVQSSEKEKPLIVVCYHGNSSQPAAQYLAEQGFADVYSMDGGFEAWKLQFDFTQ